MTVRSPHSSLGPFPLPERVVLSGAYARLEPLDPQRHGPDLLASSLAEGAESRFRYLGQPVPSEPEFSTWLTEAAASDDPLFFAVIDAASSRCHGRQALMRVAADHGVIELGNILWNPQIARTRIASEAFFLAASYVFDELGYRRLEWKCDALNEPSRRAAERFGFSFEGVFKQHMLVKGVNRDTAWYAMLDHEWPEIRRAFEHWLAPRNFAPDGSQRSRLKAPRSPARDAP